MTGRVDALQLIDPVVLVIVAFLDELAGDAEPPVICGRRLESGRGPSTCTQVSG
jgi:hypothetical protein